MLASWGGMVRTQSSHSCRHCRWYCLPTGSYTTTHIIAVGIAFLQVLILPSGSITSSHKSPHPQNKSCYGRHIFGYPLLFLIWIVVTLTKYGFISTAIIVLDVAFPSASEYKILIKNLDHHHIKRILSTSTISAHIICILTIEGEVFPSFCCLLFVLEVLHYPIIRRAETFF